jgi:hypothetical protein
MRKLFIIMIITLVNATVYAQIDSVRTDSISKKDVFSGSINYQSQLHYFGRIDTFKSSGLFPILGYEFKNGLYAQGTAVFVQSAAQPFDYTGASIEAGYKFPEKKHFEGNIFVSKFFYEDQSSLVQSALQAQTGINLTYKNKYINVNGGADLKFSDQTDIGATAGIDHLFAKKIKSWKNSALAIMPSATIYAGTQNFTTTHTKKNNFLGLPITEEKTEQVKKFNILAYEFSAPVVLVAGKMNAYVVPSYVIPQNLVITEKGANLFYVTVGLGFRL